MIETTGAKTTVERAETGRDRPGGLSILSWILPFLLLAGLLAAWEVGVRVTDTPSWFLPTPSEIARETVDSRSALWGHTRTTLLEVLVGFSIATLLGVLSALGIASSRTAERTIYPAIVASQAIPIIALAPILLIWFGYGLTPKVIVVVLICFFPIAVNMADGLRAVDPDAIALLRSMGANRWQVMRIVRIPTSLPYLLSGLRIAAAVSVIGAIVGEWVGASSGLGYLMTRSAAQFQTALLFSAVGISALLGITLFTIVALSERWLLPWRKDEKTARQP
ncbi:MAG: ABC transporter permease [Chloroflexia bacterium]|nr:ABC transporter permease [Chloroflexia bacterium]